jgi:hypothetical protein
MAFRKSALEEIAGFDPRFRVAGDDVDVCWRLRDAGHRLGFCPAAFVWHEPRDSLRAYWRQQRGYGRAEALLERKWPERYGAGGDARWSGRIYGRGDQAGLGRWRVYYGTWGSQLFQSLYAPSGGALSSFLMRPEWYLWLAALAWVSAAGLLWMPLLAATLVLAAGSVATFTLAGVSAARTPAVGRLGLSRRARAWRWLVMTTLHAVQPVARMSGRVRGFTTRSRAPRFAVPASRHFTSWSEAPRSSSDRLTEIESSVRATGTIVSRGGDYDRWDLEARRSFIGAIRIRMGLEEHGGGRQLVHLHVAPTCSRSAVALLVFLTVLGLVASLSHEYAAAILLAVVAGVLATRVVQVTGRAMGAVLPSVESSAKRRLPVHHDLRGLKVERT